MSNVIEDTPDAARAPGMLAPYRIIDLTDDNGAYCGALLGSLGADVIAVEPTRGARTRDRAPFLDGVEGPERSLYWQSYAINKRGITLDIEKPTGRQLARALIRTADAVIESMPPGRIAELGLGYDELTAEQPELVLTSLTPFGQRGPYAGFRGSDLVVDALSGHLFSTGSPDGREPTRVSWVAQSDLEAAADAAWATALALYERGLSGRGQWVDISSQASMERCSIHAHVPAQLSNEPYMTEGDRYAVLPMSPDGLPTIWATQDGFVSYGVYLSEQGRRRNPRLIAWMAEIDCADEFLINFPWQDYGDWSEIDRVVRARLQDYYQRFFASKTNRELVEAGNGRGIMLVPERTFADVIDHPQLRGRGFWTIRPHENLDVELLYPGGFCRPSESPCGLTRRAPMVGEHNAAVYAELGLGPDDLRQLTVEGVI